MKNNFYNILILFTTILAIGCSRKTLDVTVSSDSQREQSHFAQNFYDTCSLNKYPHWKFQYRLSMTNDRSLAVPLDSVIWVKSGGGRIGSRSIIKGSWLFWEDLNQCSNLGFFDNEASNGNKAEVLPPELNFSNFPELRHFRSHSIISEKHLDEVLETGKKLKGLEVYLDRDLPEEICNCEELEYLKIFCFDEINLPLCLKNLPKLKYLDLVGVGGNANKIIWEIPSLQALYLEGCDYLEIPVSVRSLKSLKQLKISSIDTLSIPIEFSELDSLELLELFRIDKKINYAGQFEYLEGLRALKMTHVSLTSFPRLKESKGLLYLTLEYVNELDTFNFDFTNKEYLHTLKLSGNAFNEINFFPEGIETLKNLEILHLREFKITEVPPSINGLTKLKDLNLVGDDLSYKSLKMIYDFNGSLRQKGFGLRSFHAKQGQLTKEQREEIQTLKNTGTTVDWRYSDKFLQAFDYYMFKLKYYQDKYRGY